MTPRSSIEHLLATVTLPADGRVLIVPSMAERPGTGAHPQLVAGLLNHFGTRATLGVPTGTPKPLRRRWMGLARAHGAQPVGLGDAGWDRVVLPGEAYMLDEVLIPAELADADHLIFVAAHTDETLGLGFVRRIAHPHSRLRARGTSERVRLDAEIASAVRARYILDGTRLAGGVPTNLCAWVSDPLTTELLGLGLRRYIDTRRGYESVTAWEHERVQAATELGLGPAVGSEIVLRADREIADIANFLGDELGCPVEWLPEKETM